MATQAAVLVPRWRTRTSFEVPLEGVVRSAVSQSDRELLWRFTRIWDGIPQWGVPTT